MGNILVYLLIIGFVLFIGFPALGWWAGRQFWRRSLADELTGAARRRALGSLVLLAGAWHLAAYCLTAVLLPWAKGAGHAPSPSPSEWAAAYLRHDLLLLLLVGVGGAGVLLARQRRLAALSWLAGCLLVLGSLRGWRAYSQWRKETESTALLPLPLNINALEYTKL